MGFEPSGFIQIISFTPDMWWHRNSFQKVNMFAGSLQRLFWPRFLPFLLIRCLPPGTPQFGQVPLWKTSQPGSRRSPSSSSVPLHRKWGKKLPSFFKFFCWNTEVVEKKTASSGISKLSSINYSQNMNKTCNLGSLMVFLLLLKWFIIFQVGHFQLNLTKKWMIVKTTVSRPKSELLPQVEEAVFAGLCTFPVVLLKWSCLNKHNGWFFFSLQGEAVCRSQLQRFQSSWFCLSSKQRIRDFSVFWTRVGSNKWGRGSAVTLYRKHQETDWKIGVENICLSSMIMK